MNPRQFAAAASFAALLLATAAAQAPEQPADVFTRLAGPGGKVSFSYGKHPVTGEAGRVRMSQGADGSFQGLTATGDLKLDTSDFDLSCLKLEYRPADDVLRAAERVRLMRTDAGGSVDATCEELLYRVASGDIELTGSPDVTQVSQGARSRFRGMDQFTVRQDESEVRTLTLAGLRPISVEIEPTEEPAAPAGEAAKPGEGFAGFGERVSIQASPALDKPPLITSRLDARGDMLFFRAEGSVVVKSDTINLRCDELTYEPAEERVEAVGHVFLRREGIEADCGRMVYNIGTGETRLTVKPEIRQEAGASIRRIYDIDYFVLQQREDGGADVEYGSADGPGRTEIITREEPATPDSEPRTPGGPAEIKLGP